MAVERIRPAVRVVGCLVERVDPVAQNNNSRRALQQNTPRASVRAETELIDAFANPNWVVPYVEIMPKKMPPTGALPHKN
jgi:hypothetical protein